MMVRWKGTITPRMEDAVPVSSLDFAPTILKACGVPVPAEMQGVDLRDDAAVRTRTAVHGECYTHNLIDFERPASSLRWRWIVEGRTKLILPHAANQPGAGPELYDLSVDPTEEHNLAVSKPGEVERLRKIADARWNP
jgi:uncharacterized sulfatase